MRLRFARSFITYIILILYVFIPVMDRTVCADCIGEPFQGDTTISHLQASHDDVSYSTKDCTQPKTSSAQDAKSFCSICANVLMGVEVSFPNPHTIVAQHNSLHTVTVFSELHYSINKPPQNLLV